MKNTALLLIAVIALGASPARAEETVVTQQRGFLSRLGVGLLIGSFMSAGLGVAAVMNANSVSATRSIYSFYTADEALIVQQLDRRIATSTALSVVGFVVSGLALAGGIICLAVDTPAAKVAFVPTAEGGVLVLSGRF
jgi:hypothetical protein